MLTVYKCFIVPPAENRRKPSEPKNTNSFLDKLPDVLDEEQKKNKVKNNLQILRKSCKIEPEGRTWHLSKTKKV